jgi:hypothetical protein
MINNLHHCPLQFNLGELSTMSTIYDTKGEGWSKVPNIERYFRSDNPRDDNTYNTSSNHHFSPIQGKPYITSQTGLLSMISNDCMAPYWGPRGAYVMSYQANAILKT